jgi:hypothetical protein
MSGDPNDRLAIANGHRANVIVEDRFGSEVPIA